jgi:hypothetical protein
MLPELEAVTLRVAEYGDTIRDVGLRLTKLHHLPSVLLDQCLHFLNQIDLEVSPA